jgi:multidrug efflux pump subunit AcrA (membrane-fusion protein)
MRFMLRGITAVLILAVALGALALAGWTLAEALAERRAAEAAAPPARERVYPARVVPVRPETVVPELTAYGEVRARRVLELRAPRGGSIAWIAPGFEDGAAVAAGQLLLRLDTADQIAARELRAADLAQAEADAREAARARGLAEAELAVAMAQARLRGQAVERQQRLRDRGAGADAALEAAELAAAAAEQAVLSRRAALAQAEARIDQAATAIARARIALAEAERAVAESELRAEFAGQLAAAPVSAGAVVAPNERLAQIVDPAALEVAFRVSAAQFARLADAGGTVLPLPVVAALDLGGVEVAAAGRITRTAAVVGAGQTGRLVYAALDAAAALRPGDFVTVRVTEPALADAAVLPARALGRGDSVLALGPGDRLEAVAVTLLRRQGDMVIVAASPLAGREVVAERTPQLSPGIRIRPLREAPGEAPGEAAGGATGEAPAAAAPDDADAMIRLTPDRRARLMAEVEATAGMPDGAKARLIGLLAQDRVPAALVARIEARSGG